MIRRENPVTPKTGLLTKKTGLIDLNNLLTEAAAWFKQLHYAFQEKQFEQKQRETAFAHEITLEGEREIDSYSKFIIELKIYTSGLSKVEVNGRSLYKGNFRGVIKAQVVIDYNKRWPVNLFYEFLFRVYNNTIVKNKIEGQMMKLYKEVLDLQSIIKKHVNIET